MRGLRRRHPARRSAPAPRSPACAAGARLPQGCQNFAGALGHAVCGLCSRGRLTRGVFSYTVSLHGKLTVQQPGSHCAASRRQLHVACARRGLRCCARDGHRNGARCEPHTSPLLTARRRTPRAQAAPRRSMCPQARARRAPAPPRPPCRTRPRRPPRPAASALPLRGTRPWACAALAETILRRCLPGRLLLPDLGDESERLCWQVCHTLQGALVLTSHQAKHLPPKSLLLPARSVT